jgi:uncharacterized protein (DUF1697 family)
MTRTHIALLRAVNTSGNKMIKMSELRDFGTSLGLENVRTLIQSGNLVFESDVWTGAEVERLLEFQAAKKLSLQTNFIVRTAEEWKRIIANNLLPDYARQDPSHLLMFTLKEARSPKEFQALQESVTGPEIVRGNGKEAYIAYPDGVGRSKLTLGVIERRLGTKSTGRNWNTVLKLDALACA